MKIRMNINTKMLVYILTSSIIIFALSVGYISLNARRLALNNAEKLALKVTQKNALKIEKSLSEDLASLRTLAQAFTVYQDMDEQEWKNLFIKMYYKVYNKNKHFYKLWDSWELSYFDTTWTKDYGRYTVVVSRSSTGPIANQSLRDIDSKNARYNSVKLIAKDMLWEPYWDEITEKDEDEKKFMTSLSSPIFVNNQFAGMVAADIIMDEFQLLLDKIKPYESTTAYLTSNEGVFIGHPDQSFIGKTIMEHETQFEDQFQLSKYIKDGEMGIFRGIDKNNNKVLVTVAPIQVGNYKAPWALTLIVPVKVVLQEANRVLNISLLVALLGVILISVIIFIIARNMSSALKQTTHILEKLSKGDIEDIENLKIDRGDEIEDMSISVNSLNNGLKETSIFAEQIGKGNLEADFKPLSDKDVLGNSLLEMRKSLKHAENEEKKRKIEDEKQNWATQGLAKFGEILRTNSHNIDILSFNIMSNLVNYLEINQGALFVIDDTQDEGQFLEMKSAIAYGRDKFMKKRVAIGEELIGRCAFEKKTIYMTDIPKDYINITSGMGTANPTSLLLIPLILNEDIFGVLELASFHKIEDYQIEFVERLGESIASTIATVKVNEKTSLLLEQSKSQAEELAAQEEEMRQNLEELQATQEEAARREFEMAGIIKALGSTAFTVEYNLEGIILGCNEKYAEMLGIAQEQIIGQSHMTGYDFSAEKKADYELFWGDLCRGILKKEINKVNYNNREFWVEETYTPITNQNDEKPYKILKIGFDITEQKVKEIKMQEQEIKIKKETLLLNEYQGRMVEIQNKLKLAQEKIAELESKKPQKTPDKKETKTQIKATGNNLLDWIPEFKLNIAEMDEQHEQLVNLINLVHSAFNNDKNKKEIKENIKSFVDFASYHFGNEEHYFEQFGFDEAKTHTAEHQKFIKEVKLFQTNYNANKVKFLDKIMTYIKEWLYNHFTNIDTQYVELFKSNDL